MIRKSIILPLFRIKGDHISLNKCIKFIKNLSKDCGLLWFYLKLFVGRCTVCNGLPWCALLCGAGWGLSPSALFACPRLGVLDTLGTVLRRALLAQDVVPLFESASLTSKVRQLLPKRYNFTEVYNHTPLSQININLGVVAERRV